MFEVIVLETGILREDNFRYEFENGSEFRDIIWEEFLDLLLKQQFADGQLIRRWRKRKRQETHQQWA